MTNLDISDFSISGLIMLGIILAFFWETVQSLKRFLYKKHFTKYAEKFEGIKKDLQLFGYSSSVYDYIFDVKEVSLWDLATAKQFNPIERISDFNYRPISEINYNQLRPETVVDYCSDKNIIKIKSFDPISLYSTQKGLAFLLQEFFKKSWVSIDSCGNCVSIASRSQTVRKDFEPGRSFILYSDTWPDNAKARISIDCNIEPNTLFRSHRVWGHHIELFVENVPNSGLHHLLELFKLLSCVAVECESHLKYDYLIPAVHENFNHTLTEQLKSITGKLAENMSRIVDTRKKLTNILTSSRYHVYGQFFNCAGPFNGATRIQTLRELEFLQQALKARQRSPMTISAQEVWDGVEQLFIGCVEDELSIDFDNCVDRTIKLAKVSNPVHDPEFYAGFLWSGAMPRSEWAAYYEEKQSIFDHEYNISLSQAFHTFYEFVQDQTIE